MSRKVTQHFFGEIIGNNKILCEEPIKKNNRIYYHVKCLSCGKERDVRSDNLHQLCRSCAAHNRIKKGNTSIIDNLIGRQFGNWLVIDKAPKSNYWTCKDITTGTVKDVFRGNLTSGKSRGDGTVCSWGEKQIAYILNQNNIIYQKEYSFKDLKGENNICLRFDFGIMSQDNQLLFLIEYQGRQHYNYNENWNQTYDEWLKLISYDKKKIEYCKKNNLKLLILNETSLLEQEILKFYNEWK